MLGARQLGSSDRNPTVPSQLTIPLFEGLKPTGHLRVPALGLTGGTGGSVSVECVSHTKLRGAVIRGVEASGGARETSSTPKLDEYGRDLTREAREGKLDPVIGRADEIEQAIEILSRRQKNNPVLLGEPGVGKTAIAEASHSGSSTTRCRRR
jgi:transcriptional regulator with PAS, ATPase and Fis domain